MRWIASAAAAALLAGCASMEYGSWLDQLGRPVAPVAMSEEEAAPLLARVQELQLREDSLRVQVAHEKDRVVRIALYRQLRDISDEKVALERSLRQAGRSPRPLLGRAPA